jgi:hypothetical protein
LLVVDIVSPDSRRRDLTEKADAYFTGGASAFWTIELPALTGVARPELTVRQRGFDTWESRGPLTGAIHLNHRSTYASTSNASCSDPPPDPQLTNWPRPHACAVHRVVVRRSAF